MVYDTSNDIQRKQLLTRVNFLVGKGSVVELKEKKPTRTTRQNSFLHSILAYFGCQIGETTQYVKDNYYKQACNRDIFEFEQRDKITGEIKKRLRSSASLTTEEMSLSIERFRNWAAQQAGIYIPSADDFAAMCELERTIKQHQEFL